LNGKHKPLNPESVEKLQMVYVNLIFEKNCSEDMATPDLKYMELCFVSKESANYR
jgi:hypothetical protein